MEGVGSAGRWQVTCADGEVLVVDVDAGTLRTARHLNHWDLASVDLCAVGAPGAFTLRDMQGAKVPWVTDRVVAVSRL